MRLERSGAKIWGTSLYNSLSIIPHYACDNCVSFSKHQDFKGGIYLFIYSLTEWAEVAFKGIRAAPSAGEATNRRVVPEAVREVRAGEMLGSPAEKHLPLFLFAWDKNYA